MTETTTNDHDLYARQGISSQISFRWACIIDSARDCGGRLPRGHAAARRRASAAARALGAPVTYSYSAYEPDLSETSRASSAPGWACVRGSEGCDIDPASRRRAGDVVFEKQHPSAFFGTDLHRLPEQAGVDSVVVWTTTSSCVGATVVKRDVARLPHRPVEAVYPTRRARRHHSALFDMGHKYTMHAESANCLSALAAG